jgi:5-(aminomethyl)-3-furanmethanol phosphate kinase
MSTEQSWAVVKVGGSLYDLPDLRQRLLRLLQTLAQQPILLFPGGGPFAEVIRRLDERHGLGQEMSHWLAVHSLGSAANFLTGLLQPTAAVVATLDDCRNAWSREILPVLEPFPFFRSDHAHSDHLPCSWDVTSDSLALHLARRWGAARLVLLKSTDAPTGWPETTAENIVDPHFQRLLAMAHRSLIVSAINFRDETS